MRTLLLLAFLGTTSLVFAAGPPPPGGSGVYPFLDDFEPTLPTQVWSGGAMAFSALANHGDNASTGLSINLKPGTEIDSTFTPLVGTLGTASVLSFDYRFVDSLDYPNTATQLPADAEFKVSMSLSLSGPFTQVSSITPSNHNTSTNFVSVNVPIGVDFASFNGLNVYFMVRANRGNSGNYYLDIDNFSVANGTPLTLETASRDENRFFVYVDAGQLRLSGQPENGILQIFDLQGRKVLNTHINQASGISIADWSDGIYFAVIQDKASKFIVKK